jgi:TonB family protein
LGIAQSRDTTYLDVNYRYTSKTDAAYYKYYEAQDSLFIKRMFYINHQLKEEVLVSFTPKETKVGEQKRYYSSGQLQERGFYVDGNMRGDYESYFENGQQQSDIFFQEDGEKRYDQFWNEVGKPLLENGTGEVRKDSEKGDEFVNRFVDYYMTASFHVRKDMNDSVYTVATTNPEYIGGYAKFQQTISELVKYPKLASSMGVHGRVYVELIVNKTGELEEVRVVKGIGYGCDEEALRAIQLTEKWNPGEYEGQPVKMKMALPIYFKL